MGVHCAGPHGDITTNEPGISPFQESFPTNVDMSFPMPGSFLSDEPEMLGSLEDPMVYGGENYVFTPEDPRPRQAQIHPVQRTVDWMEQCSVFLGQLEVPLCLPCCNSELSENLLDVYVVRRPTRQLPFSTPMSPSPSPMFHFQCLLLPSR